MDVQTFLQIAGLAIAMTGIMSSAMIAVFRYLITKRDSDVARLHNRIDEQDKKHAELTETIARMPFLYVVREDWIRLSTSIDLKFDKLFDLILQQQKGKE